MRNAVTNTVSNTGSPANRISSCLRLYKQQMDLFLLFIPVLLYFMIFNYGPMYGIIIAFKDYSIVKGIFASPWVGLQNFKDMFISLSFKDAFLNTIIISFMKLIFGFPAPIILAILINEISHTAFKKITQTVSYLPHFLSWVVLAGVFMQFLSPSTGVVNQVIKALGGKPIFFLGDPQWFRSTIVATYLWQSMGWGSIIYLASISSIDVEMYEAAVMDGANRFQQTLYITVPSLIPVITVMLILATGNIINAGFDQIFNMYNPAVYKVADILDTYIYRRGLAGMEYSFSTAVGLFKNLISLFLIFITNHFSKKLNDYGIW